MGIPSLTVPTLHTNTNISNMNSMLIFVCLIGAALARPQEIFSYEADTHAQSASGDAGNSVEGSYSYTAPNGDEIVVTYTADAENGYVAKSSALPVAPEVPAFEFDPAVLPVAPEVPVVEPLVAPKAYTFIGPQTIEVPAHPFPHHFGYSHLPYAHLPYALPVAH